MSELIVLAFDNEEGALQTRDKLLDIRKRRMLQLADAAVVVRRQDGKVKVKQLTDLVGSGACALGGSSAMKRWGAQRGGRRRGPGRGRRASLRRGSCGIRR